MTSDTLEAIDALAHDLRNDVNVLLAGSSLLEGSADEETAGIAHDLALAARRLARWSDQVIEAARSDLGRERQLDVIEFVAVRSLALRRSSRMHPGISVLMPEIDATLRVGTAAAERLLAGACVLAAGGAGTVRAEVGIANDVLRVRLHGVPDCGTGRTARGELLLLAAIAAGNGITMRAETGLIELMFDMAPA